MEINVERYFKTHVARPQPASTVVMKNESGPTQSTETVAGDEMEGIIEFSGVKQARTYKVNDPDAPGGKKDVEFETLAKGYEYGRTAVPISESEHNVTKLESTKGFSIVGFIPWDKVNFNLWWTRIQLICQVRVFPQHGRSLRHARTEV
jgi:ATP-dependent DNA helicase 2 subunit 2